MYKLFKKALKKNLKIYLEERSFRHYKDETFICFHNELLFILSFDKGSYGTSLNMSLSIGVPVVQNNFLNETDLETFSIKGSTLGSAKWELEKYNKYDLENKNKKINEYIEDIKYIYTNYISHYISKEINSFDMEKYIEHEYDSLFDDYLDERGEEDPACTYQIEFLGSGKSQDAWSKEDDEKCEELTKSFQNKNFPYENVKKQILMKMEENKPKYRELISQYFTKKNSNIKIDKEIFPISLKEVMKKGAVNERLINIGFLEYINKNLQGLQDYGESLFFKKDDIELRVIIKDELFLEFIIIKDEIIKRINKYDGNYFWFGWLIGKEELFEINIDKAFERLKIELHIISQ